MKLGPRVSDWWRPLQRLRARGVRTLPSPSPQPSPLGRGGIAGDLSNIRGASGFHKTGRAVSLSPRERVGVRGKAADCDPQASRHSGDRGGGREGVALVITLVLLAVITFMAVTFLLVSHSERGQVSQQIEQKSAELAADAAFERAKVEMIARMLAFTNP